MENDTARELLVVGLRNAHAMEKQAREMIERQIGRTDDYPDVKARLREHLVETEDQIERLEGCLDKLGESHSGLKDAALATIGNMASMGHMVAGDEILKNTFANNAFENFEVAAYKSLLTLAESAGVQMKQVLSQSLREEERMAAWVEANVEKITLGYLAQEQREAA